MQPSSENSPQEGPTPIGDGKWMAWHLFHEEDLEGVLWEVVRPTVRELREQGLIDSFFFIRYPEGGNHVRLRLRCAPRPEPEEVERRAGEVLTSFAGRWRPKPSARAGASTPLTPRRFPFEPEVERYGGEALLPLSVDFFTLSSVDALRFVGGWSHQPRSRQLTDIMRRLLGQALGLARDWPEALSLLDYFAGRQQEMKPILARADQTFEANQEALAGAFRDHVRGWMEQGALVRESPVPEPLLLAEASRCLAAALGELEPAARESVKASQMHMTANRLGLLNAEESYLTRLLCRCAGALEAREPLLLRTLDEWLRARQPPPQPAQRLATLLREELTRLPAPDEPGSPA